MCLLDMAALHAGVYNAGILLQEYFKSSIF